MCGDGSPYSTVHQVIPGGHVDETVQGEFMREQLENRITQVWLIHIVGIMSNTKQPQVLKKKRRVYLINSVLIYGDRLEPEHQSLHFWIRACPWSQFTIYNGHRLKPFRQALLTYCISLCGCYTQQKRVSCFRRHTVQSLSKRMSQVWAH